MQIKLYSRQGRAGQGMARRGKEFGGTINRHQNKMEKTKDGLA